MEKHGKSIKADWTVQEIKATIKKYDVDADAKLNLDEFTKALSDMTDRKMTKAAKKKDLNRQWTWKKQSHEPVKEPEPAPEPEPTPEKEMTPDEVAYWMEERRKSVEKEKAAADVAAAEAAKVKAKASKAEEAAAAVEEAKAAEQALKVEAKLAVFQEE